MKTTAIGDLVKKLAQSVGFDLCGIAPAQDVGRGDYYRQWLEQGHAGGMDYMARYVEQRQNAAVLLPGAKSVIVCGLNYAQPAPKQPPSDQPIGQIASYAWGDDYHKVIKAKLFKLADQLKEQIDQPHETKACVDTAPILEREYAALAGLGWIGKNTLAINRHHGSYFLLGEIVTTLDIVTDSPATDHCGTCTKCLEACPTGALIEPYRMDASRCISYLTIENRESGIPDHLGPLMGDWVFGCDICQQVCPHNSKTPTTKEPRFTCRPPSPRPSLTEMINWSDEEYIKLLQGSAIKRAKPEMLRRNAKTALDNTRASAADECNTGN